VFVFFLDVVYKELIYWVWHLDIVFRLASARNNVVVIVFSCVVVVVAAAV